MYKLSYLWLAPIGVTTVISIGLLVSYLTGTEDSDFSNPDLFSPVIKRFVPNMGRLRQPATAECAEINNRAKDRTLEEDSISTS
jgi:hypothetical protein